MLQIEQEMAPDIELDTRLAFTIHSSNYSDSLDSLFESLFLTWWSWTVTFEQRRCFIDLISLFGLKNNLVAI